MLLDCSPNSSFYGPPPKGPFVGSPLGHPLGSTFGTNKL